MKISSFPAVVDRNTRVLILGSMPGVRSLEAGEYYANPRNRFWRLMHELLGVPMQDEYSARIEQLMDRGVGLWDVLKHCERQGSLDAAIRAEQPNNFAELRKIAPHLRSLAFNGQKAAASFSRFIEKGTLPGVELTTLPSTSPANAGIRYDQLLERWRVVLGSVDSKK